jgi:hypothetical protein
MKKYTYTYYESIVDGDIVTPIARTTWESNSLDDWNTMRDLFGRLEELPNYSGWANTLNNEFGIWRELEDGREELRGVSMTINKE